MISESLPKQLKKLTSILLCFAYIVHCSNVCLYIDLHEKDGNCFKSSNYLLCMLNSLITLGVLLVFEHMYIPNEPANSSLHMRAGYHLRIKAIFQNLHTEEIPTMNLRTVLKLFVGKVFSLRSLPLMYYLRETIWDGSCKLSPWDMRYLRNLCIAFLDFLPLGSTVVLFAVNHDITWSPEVLV